MFSPICSRKSPASGTAASSRISIRRRGAVHRLRPAGAAGGGKIVHIPIITEKITEYPLLESCFLAALNFLVNFFEKFLKNR